MASGRDREGKGGEKEREREKDGSASNYFVAVGEQSPNLAVISCSRRNKKGRK